VDIVFVVGSGRNGSTVLSEILGTHPDVLSISELWAMVGFDMIDVTPVSGADFWMRLATPNPVLTAMFRAGIATPEFRYLQTAGRFRPEDGVPPLCVVTLAHLSSDPDAIFDELDRVVPSWPVRPLADHWRALFGLLGPGRSVAVERSGYSISAVRRMRAAFPEARFVHLYRNGPDCALSMSRHPAFRLILLQNRMRDMLGLRSTDDLRPEHADLLPALLGALLGPDSDMRTLVMERALPLVDFGAMWSEAVRCGLADLDGLPGRLDLRYEDLLDHPERELVRFAEYVGVTATPDWVRAGVDRIDRTRRGAARQLSPPDRDALAAACRPGMQALGLG
jgi:hypothetical protein